MTRRRHGIQPYWLSMRYRIGERLRAGERMFIMNDFHGSLNCRVLAAEFGLVEGPYGGFIPGPGTYAAIERHIESKLRAEKQWKAGEFPRGVDLRRIA